MTIVLIIIAVLLWLIFWTLRAINANFAKWATEDITYKSYVLRRDNPSAPPRKNGAR